jgi:hypothetical protein
VAPPLSGDRKQDLRPTPQVGTPWRSVYLDIHCARGAPDTTCGVRPTMHTAKLMHGMRGAGPKETCRAG